MSYFRPHIIGVSYSTPVPTGLAVSTAMPPTTRETQTSKQTVRQVSSKSLAWVYNNKFAFSFLVASGVRICRTDSVGNAFELIYREPHNDLPGYFTLEFDESERQDLFDFFAECVLPMIEAINKA